jgi:hypothetical protein
MINLTGNFDTYPMEQLVAWADQTLATASENLPYIVEALPRFGDGEGALILGQNEGFSIRNRALFPAAASATFWCDVQWSEAIP